MTIAARKNVFIYLSYSLINGIISYCTDYCRITGECGRYASRSGKKDKHPHSLSGLG